MTMKSDFVSQLPRVLYIHGYICELIGSIILSARLVWGFVDTLPINTSLW